MTGSARAGTHSHRRPCYGALAGHDYLMGKQFTVADGYLFTMLSWADRMKFDLSALPNLLAYKARVGARPKVQEALTKEGLVKAA